MTVGVGVAVLVYVGAGVSDAATGIVGVAVGVNVPVGSSAVTVMDGCGLNTPQANVNKPRSKTTVIAADLFM